MDTESSYLGTTDYLIFSLVLVVSASIGVYFRLTGGRQKSAKEYFMADKNMSIFPVTCSLMASQLSAVTLLGVSKEGYVYGTQILVIVFGHLLGVLVTILFYLPVFFKLQKTSLYEYLELRFGRVTRLIASGIFIFQMVLYISLVLYAPVLALTAVTGFSKWASVLSVGLICTFYSTIGGMKAVLWTDVFQAILMFTTLFAVIIKGLLDSNGIQDVWQIALTGKRIEFLNSSFDPTIRHTVWTQTVGGAFIFLFRCGANQMQIQRLLTIKELRKSQAAALFSWPLFAFIYLLSCFAGLIIYSRYHDCDPILTKRIKFSDQLLPLFIMESLSHIPGLAGLVISGIFSGALSTVSSAVNSLAATTLEDFIKPLLAERWQKEHHLSVLMKVLACAFGLTSVALTFVADNLGGIFQASAAILGVTGGPLLGLFSMGLFLPRCTERSAIIGFLVGVTFGLWVGIGAVIYKPFTPELSRSISGCFIQGNGTAVNFIMTNLSANNNRSMELPTIQSNNLHTLLLHNDSYLDLHEQVISDRVEATASIFYLYRISYMWYTPLNCIIAMVVGMLVSLCEKKRDVNGELLSPVCRFWYSAVASSTCEAEVRLKEKTKYNKMLITSDRSFANNSLETKL